MNFEDLTPGWKALSVLGIIFSLLCIGLVILVVLMFETDIVPWPMIEPTNSEEIEDEFGDFLNEFEFGNDDSIDNQYKHPTKDLNGNPVLDLMEIQLVT